MKIPQYEHDCRACIFLGAIRQGDAYYHPHGDWHTLLFRHSSRSDDYDAIRSTELDRVSSELWKEINDLALAHKE